MFKTQSDPQMAMNNDEQINSRELVVVKPKESALVRVPRSVVFHPSTGKRIDSNVVHFRYYNSFNYSLLAREKTRSRLTVGITSPNAGEGKTLVAANLAVSLTLGYQKKTVLVDLNVHRPRLHEIFGIPVSPGLIETLHDGPVNVTRTEIENLSILPVGSMRHRRTINDNGNIQSYIGLEDMSSFSDVIYSLEHEFEFVIVDMPSINSRDFPILFANQLNGLLVVVDVGRTKREDIEKMFRQVNENQVLGFVFNRVTDQND
jgi:protein-tyrosine kinase